jgi:hypothetical protein
MLVIVVVVLAVCLFGFVERKKLLVRKEERRKPSGKGRDSWLKVEKGLQGLLYCCLSMLYCQVVDSIIFLSLLLLQSIAPPNLISLNR